MSESYDDYINWCRIHHRNAWRCGWTLTRNSLGRIYVEAIDDTTFGRFITNDGAMSHVMNGARLGGSSFYPLKTETYRSALKLIAGSDPSQNLGEFLANLPPEKEPEAMPMSKDRIRFIVPSYRIHRGADCSRIRSLLKEIFGITDKELRAVPVGRDLTIVCRPSQFGRYIVRRNEEGCTNWVREMSPVLFTPNEPEITEIDVHTREAA